mgnify:FL=1
MKPLKTKAQARRELEQQMLEFLHSGGEVENFAMGDSGREVTTSPPIPVSFEGPKVERTPVVDVVSAIEARRGKKGKPATQTRPRKPRKALILDDFGQPLRWHWVED